MVHWMQRERKRNLDLIRSWVSKGQESKVDYEALTRKAILVLGCTRAKAKEYLSEIFGEILDE